MKINSELKELLNSANVECRNSSHPKLEPMHIGIAMMLQTDGIGLEIIQYLDGDIDKIFDEINDLVVNNLNISLLGKNPNPILSSTSQDIVISASKYSVKLLSEQVGVEHLMLGLTEIESDIKQILNKFGITLEKLLTLYEEKTPDEIREHNYNTKTTPSMNMGDYEDGTINFPTKTTNNKSTTPVIDSFSRDLTKMAKEGLIQDAIGRDDVIDAVITTLLRKNKRNPLIVGEAGVGKTTIVDALALRIIQEKVPLSLINKRLVLLDTTKLVSGTKYRGQFEERMTALIKELETNPDLIVFIDEIHTIIGTGSASNSLDFSNIIKPSLSKGLIQVIGSTTHKEYSETIEKDGALDRRFQKIMVNEPSVDETIEILEKTKYIYEEHHTVSYPKKVVALITKLADRFVFNKHFPDKAFDILDETGAYVRKNAVIVDNELSDEIKEISDLIKKQTKEIADLNVGLGEAIKKSEYQKAANLRDDKIAIEKQLSNLKSEYNTMYAELMEKPIDAIEISEADVYEIVKNMTKIPVDEMFNNESYGQTIVNLENELNTKVIGQENAISEVYKHMARMSVGIRDENKPSVLMFVGQTGVGKTLVAKELAKEYFKNTESFIRLNMNDYQSEFMVTNIIGSPKGYSGDKDTPKFLENVKNNPYSVVLLDEIEKAHPLIFNAFLQIFDEGMFTTNDGLDISFKNVIFILTSNIGVAKASEIRGNLGFSYNSENTLHEIIMSEVNKYFKPELLNRISKIVMFENIKKGDVTKIVELECGKLIKRLAMRDKTIVFKPEVYELIGEKGYSEKFGARNIIRTIEDMVEVDLALFILSNPKKKKITISVKNGAIQIK